MISATAPFLAANAVNQKKPTLVLLLRNCKYAFSTAAIAGTPTAYPDLKAGALCGAFTDSGGNVIQPLAIGASPTTLIVPPGATQLQLGINSFLFIYASGSFLVEISTGNTTSQVTVNAGDGPWVMTGGINAAYTYGNFGDPPTGTCVAATGLIAGQVIQVSYLSGTVSIDPAGGGVILPFVDADGESADGWWNSYDGYGIGATLGISTILGYYPTLYMGSQLKPWIVNVDDHSTTVSDLDGGVDLADLTMNVQDTLQAITALFPSYVFEGQRATLLMGYVGMALADFIPMFTGVIATVSDANGNTEYVFDATSFNAQKLTTNIYTTGDDGFAINSTHPKTINAHPIDILVSALGQCGVPPSSIDTAKLYFYRDTIYSGLSFAFTLTSSPTGKDFIESELMKPLGAYLRENNAGLLTANFFYPALSGNANYTPPTPPVATLDQSNTEDMPLAGEADLVNAVTFRFDDDGTGNGNFLAESVQQYGLSVQKYGLVGSQIIESTGMRSGFQGYLWAELISRLIFLRYGLKNLLLTAVPFLWSECLLEPGDIIQLTIAQIPNRTGGTLGVTNLTFEVLSRTWQFMTGLIELDLLAIDLSAFRQYQITPNAEADYTLASSGDKAKYMFLCGTNDEYSNGDPANTLC
jgi:hypothetical protein